MIVRGPPASPCDPLAVRRKGQSDGFLAVGTRYGAAGVHREVDLGSLVTDVLDEIHMVLGAER